MRIYHPEAPNINGFGCSVYGNIFLETGAGVWYIEYGSRGRRKREENFANYIRAEAKAKDQGSGCAQIQERASVTVKPAEAP